MKAIKKEFIAEIHYSFSRFISILLIVALGVAFYSGIRATEPDMRITGDNLYDNSNLMDIKIISTMGLTNFDIDKLKTIDKINQVEGTYSKDVIVKTKDLSESVVKFQAETDNINIYNLEKGQKPQNNKECILDKTYMDKQNIKIGDLISISSGSDEDILDSIESNELKVVGSFTSSQYLSNNLGSSSIGNGKINGLAIVKKDAFKKEVYTEIIGTVKGAKELNCYSDEYFSLIDDVKNEIDSKIKNICIKQRYDDLYNTVDNGVKEVSSNISKIKTQIDDGNKGISQADESIKKMDDMKKKIKTEIESIQKNIDNYDYYINKYKTAGAVPKGVLNSNEVSMEQLEREKSVYVSSMEPLNKEINKLDENIKKANSTIDDLNLKIKEANENVDKLELLKADTIEERDSIKSPSWYILDRNSVPTFADYDNDALRIGKIGEVFPIIFFLVAALVSLTTMTRMISEQRTQIGTLMALGYGKATITGKYIKYAMLATIGGSIIGSVIGVKLLPKVILNAYTMLYPGLKNPVVPFNYKHSIIASILAIICVLTATLFAAYKTMKSNSADLMRPQAPPTGKKILLERVGFIWKHINFNGKSTIRNLVRYKKRFFMTLFGVSGCMALIIVGFGIKDSTSAIVNNQYGKIHIYDASITFNATANDKRLKEVKDFINTDKRIDKYLESYQTNTEVDLNGIKNSAYIFVPLEQANFNEYIDLKERKSEKKLTLLEDAVIIDEKLAELYNVKVGDSIDIKIDKTTNKSVKIGGICENYLYHYIYMTPSLYKNLYGKNVKYNQVFLKTKGNVDTTQMTKDILNFKACSSATFNSVFKEKINEVLSSIDIIVMVLIVSAGGLALVVLYNLNNINISERKRELATLRVLGFYDKEVAGYVVRENIIISLLGLIAGCGLGMLLHQYVIRTAELDMIMFGRNLSIRSYIYGGAITLIFALLINFAMTFKIKKIDMAESMKSVE